MIWEGMFYLFFSISHNLIHLLTEFLQFNKTSAPQQQLALLKDSKPPNLDGIMRIYRLVKYLTSLMVSNLNVVKMWNQSLSDLSSLQTYLPFYIHI